MNNRTKNDNNKFKFNFLNFCNLFFVNICFGLIIQKYFATGLIRTSQSYNNLTYILVSSLFAFICGLAIAKNIKLKSKRLKLFTNSSCLIAAIILFIMNQIHLELLYNTTSLSSFNISIILLISYLLIFIVFGMFLNLWLRRNSNYFRKGTFITFFFGLIIGLLIGQTIILHPTLYIFLTIAPIIALVLCLFYSNKLLARIAQGIFICLSIVAIVHLVAFFNKVKNMDYNNYLSKQTSLSLRSIAKTESYGLRGLWNLTKLPKLPQDTTEKITASLNNNKKYSYNLFQTTMFPLVALLMNGQKGQKVLYYSPPEIIDDLYYLFAVKSFFIIKPDRIFANNAYGTKMPKNCQRYFLKNNIFKIKEKQFDTIIYTLPNNATDLESMNSLELLYLSNNDDFLKNNGVLLFKLNSTPKDFKKLLENIKKHLNYFSLTNFMKYAVFNIDEKHYGLALVKNNSATLPKNTAQLDQKVSELIDPKRTITLAGIYALILRDSFELKDFNQQKILSGNKIQLWGFFNSLPVYRNIFSDNFKRFVKKIPFNFNQVKFLMTFIILTLIYLISKTACKRHFYSLRVIRCFDFGVFQGISIFTIITTTLLFSNSVFYEFSQLIMMFSFGILFSLISYKPPIKLYSVITTSALIIVILPFFAPKYTLIINSITIIIIALNMRKLLLDYIRNKHSIKNIISYFLGMSFASLIVLAVIYNLESYFYLIVTMLLAYNDEFLLSFQKELRR